MNQEGRIIIWSKTAVWLIGIGGAFIIDRFAKASLFVDPPTIPWLADLFFIVPTINRGIAFGIYTQWIEAIIVPIALIIIGFAAWQSLHFLRHDDLRGVYWLGLLLGALSNIMDRLAYGGVADYIMIPYLTTFNIADCLIVISAVMIVLREVRVSK